MWREGRLERKNLLDKAETDWSVGDGRQRGPQSGPEGLDWHWDRKDNCAKGVRDILWPRQAPFPRALPREGEPALMPDSGFRARDLAPRAAAGGQEALTGAQAEILARAPSALAQLKRRH